MSLRPFPLGYRIALEVASEMICIHLPDWPLLPLLNIFRIDWGGVEQETSSSIIIREAPTPIARFTPAGARSKNRRVLTICGQGNSKEYGTAQQD